MGVNPTRSMRLLWSVMKINKIVTFVLMLVAGSILNVLTGNVILTSVGCFALGYVLNRSRKPNAPKADTASTPVRMGTIRPKSLGKPKIPQLTPYPASQVRTASSCPNCRAAISSHHKFCRSCGARTKPLRTVRREANSGKYNPEYIRTKLERIGDEDEDRYQDLVQNVLLIDDWGRYWSMGAQTSKWYVYENGSWIPDRPMGMMRIRRRTSSLNDHDFQTVLGIEQSTGRGLVRTTCSSCNSQVKPSQKFCKRCGSRLVQAA